MANRADARSRSAPRDISSNGRLRQFLAYARKTFGLGELLDGIVDRRKDPQCPTSLVMRILFLVGLLRFPSFNNLEPKLATEQMQRALGRMKVRGDKICSVDTLGYSLKRVDLSTMRAQVVKVIRKAERNKAFRGGWFGGLGCVAIDGWEPISSYEQHCPACLTREVWVGKGDNKRKRTQYYHRYVVAMYVDETLDVVLDMEEIRSADARKERGDPTIDVAHEGELTAAKRLVPRLRQDYGRWIDTLLLDALYANGPFLTLADKHGLGVIVVLKNENHEPLKEALALLKDEPPEKVVEVGHNEDGEPTERIELWDCPPLETLSTYKGGIRVVRAVVHHRTGQVRNWFFGATGKAARLLTAQSVTSAGRARWHIENTAFDQWTQYWHFCHVFVHDRTAFFGLLWMFVLVFNLLQIFVYRQLKGYGRLATDVTRTIISLIDEMNEDRARLTAPLPWGCWDTS